MTRFNMRQCLLALICLCLLAFTSACSSTTNARNTNPSTHNDGSLTTAPTPSPTPIPPVYAGCPAVGTARAAVMPPLSAGNHQGVLYVSNSGSTGVITSASTTTSILSRYDVTSGQKTDLLKITVPEKLQNNQLETPAISKARLSNNGQWIVFQTAVEGKKAIQLVRADGKELQTLYCTTVDKDIWDALSFSPDMRYITFEDLPIQTSGDQNLILLELSTGKLHIAAQISNAQAGAIYEPIKWRDNTSLYANYSLIGVGDTRNRHKVYLLPDVTGNSTPQQVAIPTIAGASNDLCKDFDFSPDNAQLLVSDCHSNGNQQDPTGPSTIEIVPLTGGAPRIVHTSQHAIQYARFIANTTIWFSVSDSADLSQNGVWKINTDGSGLMQLTTEAANFEFLAYAPNMHLSPDNTSFVFLGTNDARTSTTLMIGSISGGNITNFDTGIPATSPPGCNLIGWSMF